MQLVRVNHCATAVSAGLGSLRERDYERASGFTPQAYTALPELYTSGINPEARGAVVQFLLAALAAVMAAFAAGCGSGGGTTVSGQVTYEEAPVASGQIMFTPADGKGPIVGGPISAGSYSLSEVPPGQKVVQVSSIEDAPVILSSEDMAKAAQSGKPAAPPPKVMVPPNAGGNGATVEIKSGKQTLDIHLQKPAGS